MIATKEQRIIGARHCLADIRRMYRLHFCDRPQYRLWRKGLSQYLTELRADQHPYWCDCEFCTDAQNRYDEVTG